MKPKQNKKGTIYQPEGVDACQSPSYSIYPILNFIKRNWLIWEPAMGRGWMVRWLERSGLWVFGTDILYGQNFFEYNPYFFDAIITNPPYTIKYPWFRRCCELDKPFALLMPVETIGSAKGQKIIEQYGIEIVWFRPRINFYMPNKGYAGGGSQFPTAWFTRGFNIGKPMTFVEIPKLLIDMEAENE